MSPFTLGWILEPFQSNSSKSASYFCFDTFQPALKVALETVYLSLTYTITRQSSSPRGRPTKQSLLQIDCCAAEDGVFT